MKKCKWMSKLFALLCLTGINSVQCTEIVINWGDPLAIDILTLVINKADPNIHIKQLSEDLPEQRLIEAVQLGKLDLLWAGASPHIDEELLAVRIPLFKGLLGHRVFLIKKENQYRFDNIKTLGQLKKLTAGQGTLWGDTKVLQDAGLPIVTTVKYPNLFYMLEGERFDYFPRALHEPWGEVASRKELHLAVEKKVLLVYPLAMYLYVKKGNQALHDTLVKGFELSIADGSFDELFFNNPMIKDTLQKSNLQNRNVIRINNPNMHPDTPLNRPELWLDINSLK